MEDTAVFNTNLPGAVLSFVADFTAQTLRMGCETEGMMSAQCRAVGASGM